MVMIPSSQPHWAVIVIAVIGAVLGCLNTWMVFQRDRVRLKVIPKSYVTTAGAYGLCVDVVNLGALPVTVISVEFTLAGAGGKRLHIKPDPAIGSGLPQRMEPRTAWTAYCHPGVELRPEFAIVRHAVVVTACGRQFHGHSPALASVVRAAQSKANS